VEYTILGCDLCPKRPKPRDAVATRRLDLCAKHDRQFRPKVARGRPRKHKHAKPSKPTGKRAERLAEAEARVLAALKRAGAEGLKGAALATAARLNKNTLQKAALRLLAKKAIVRKGKRKGFIVKEAA
jgi:hypothetical protein